ncbi:MAG: Flp pilus assembly protein CpaB [bacterium]
MNKIIIAVALAVAVVMFNYMYITTVRKQYESGDFAWVVVCTSAVKAHLVVRPDEIEVKRVDAAVAKGNQISLEGNTLSTSGKTFLLNQVQFHIAQTAVPEGAIVNQAMIAENLDDSFSRKIPEGKRAVTVNVDDETGIAGLIRPNDRIDVIGNFQVEAGKDPRGQPIQGLYTQTLLQNVEVLAVGKDAGIGLSQELVQDPNEAKAQFGHPTSVTLAVTPEQAQMLVHVRKAGSLSASLRPGPYNPAEGDETLKPITDSDVLDTDAVLVLKNQAYNPFQSGQSRF